MQIETKVHFYKEDNFFSGILKCYHPTELDTVVVAITDEELKGEDLSDWSDTEEVLFTDIKEGWTPIADNMEVAGDLEIDPKTITYEKEEIVIPGSDSEIETEDEEIVIAESTEEVIPEEEVILDDSIAEEIIEEEIAPTDELIEEEELEEESSEDELVEDIDVPILDEDLEEDK